MSRFNLIDEKWIPVRFLNGDREELGIRDTLLRAKEIAAIENSSPLIVASLHRFLLAVLYRALEGPNDIDQTKELFKTGLPGDKIQDYLKTWHDRFWLFDEKYPFGQNPNVPAKEIEPWTKLTAEHNATTNKVLFDHTDTKNPGQREPKECVRWLLSTMNFSVSGGRGYYPSPSSNAILCIPSGRNLHETLCYCLVPYRNREVMREDSALWEREPKTIPLVNPKRISFGYADIFTWQSRMILLEELPSGCVSAVRFVAGEGFDNPTHDSDTMQPYKSDKLKGKLPVQFREDRGTWRDFDSLIPDADGFAPQVMQNAIRLAENKTDNLPRSLLVLGLRYEPPNANVDFWRMERFALPGALVGDKSVRSDIRSLLDDAKETQEALWSACGSYARDLLSRGERKPDGKDIKKVILQMPAIPCYWSIMESKFHEVLQAYALEVIPDEIELQWLQELRDALRNAWNLHRVSVSSGDVWTIRALIKAEGHISRKINELDAIIADFKKSLNKENL